MTAPRFCQQCGKSLVPLAGPHVQRPCADCGKTVHVAEPGEGGQGSVSKRGTSSLFLRTQYRYL